MNKKMLITFVLLAALTSSLCIPAFAATNSFSGKDPLARIQGGFDTLDYTQEEYLSQNTAIQARNVDSELV